MKLITIIIITLCAILTSVFYKLHLKYIYAYDTINNTHLQPNLINITVMAIGLSVAMVISIHSIYEKLKEKNQS